LSVLRTSRTLLPRNIIIFMFLCDELIGSRIRDHWRALVNAEMNLMVHTKRWEIFEQLHNYWLLKRGRSPWSLVRQTIEYVTTEYTVNLTVFFIQLKLI
jgi:hypothetical protein